MTPTIRVEPKPGRYACAEDAAGLVLSYPFRRPSPSEHRHVFAACVLAAFPNTSTEADPMPSDRSNTFPPLLRRAIAFIDENAHASISLGDIAAAIHVTPRAVQYMFSRHLETTPLTYLRRVWSTSPATDSRRAARCAAERRAVINPPAVP
jgi:transcriptional regulator GlxA family with amidase domain